MLKALQSFFNVAPAAEQTKQFHAEGLSDNTFLSLILMTEISLADGTLSPEERNYLLADLKNEYQLDDETAENAIEKAINAVKEAASLHDFTAPLKALEYSEKVQLLETLWAVAYTDNELDPHEEAMLRKLADLLYINHADYIKAKLSVTGH
ncbi:TerB family tellurite resistance protein [Idiomarina sp. X4]|uniref:tellurite resistance TerB family protein n=1 Tax=Idiomarina TaxID=135575 RepID=UPI000C28FD0E|nr:MULTISPECIES: TerB family tellurite resistance protein [Idiomarina]ATZ72665.1 TerB family tellurite resistance protein [Idiomarina sp. X4]MTJ02316.1 TerB family tellurite resistance protein [Idiomarina piscisalsi]